MSLLLFKLNIGNQSYYICFLFFKSLVCIFFKKINFCTAILGSQQNPGGSTGTSHIPPTPTHAQSPPLCTYQTQRYNCYCEPALTHHQLKPRVYIKFTVDVVLHLFIPVTSSTPNSWKLLIFSFFPQFRFFPECHKVAIIQYITFHIYVF